LINLLHVAHEYIQKVLPKGGMAVDATVGNGHDTLFLAKAVGETGRVYGFDIQDQAIANTKERLVQEGQDKQVHLFQYPHQQPWSSVLPKQFYGKVDAVMLNLGYLPRGDTSIVTKPSSTIIACKQALAWLKPKGLVTIMLYTGHEGGKEEAENVIEWCRQLPDRQYQVLLHQRLNRFDAPMLAVISKLHSMSSS
jgi:predicted methyltransferase